MIIYITLLFILADLFYTFRMDYIQNQMLKVVDAIYMYNMDQLRNNKTYELDYPNRFETAKGIIGVALNPFIWSCRQIVASEITYEKIKPYLETIEVIKYEKENER